MNRPHRLAALTVSSVLLAAGCGNAVPAARPSAAQVPAHSTVTLSSALDTAAGAWAVAVMGGPSAHDDNFWQVFARQAGSTRWTLATPPGVADNGGLVLAYASGKSLIAGFRPSQNLTYTPLTESSDGGQTWSSAGPLDGDLADVPDALASDPGRGQLLALLADGTAMLAVPGYASWSTLTTGRNLAATPPGQRCGLTSLTAVAFSPAGAPLLAGTCTEPGIAGIFAGQAGTWQSAGPPLPAALAHQPITVLRLTRLAGTMVALLAAGSGSTATLLAAWSSSSGTHWKLSQPLRLGGARLTSASFGSDGTAALTLTTGTGETITDAGASWQSLPALPAGTAALAPGPGGSLEALAVHRSVLTVWHLVRSALTWYATQTIEVPMQFGSSG